MSTPEMKYYLPEYETAADARQLPERGSEGHNYFTAIRAAEHLHDIGRCDPVMDWPVEIALVSDDGLESRWDVTLDWSPTFMATQHKEAKQ